MGVICPPPASYFHDEAAGQLYDCRKVMSNDVVVQHRCSLSLFVPKIASVITRC